MSEVEPIEWEAAFTRPEYSDWVCDLFGHPSGISYRPRKSKTPCWFHRKMQTLILGHKWRKVKP